MAWLEAPTFARSLAVHSWGVRDSSRFFEILRTTAVLPKLPKSLLFTRWFGPEWTTGFLNRWTTAQIGWTAFWQMDDGPNRLDGLFGRWTTNLIG